MIRQAVIAFMLPTVALAGWGTNMWPAYQFPRSGTAQGMECYSSLVERCKAVGVVPETIDAPVWYRSQRGDLSGFKDDVKTLLAKRWLNTGVCTASNAVTCLSATVPADLYGFGSTPDPSPRLTPISLCSNANLPTNFFDYTPWRCLSGLGPFTNDATVGHPYAYTNVYTMAGGSNTFPSGRTNWYTTDYGWDGMKMAISAMTHTFGVFRRGAEESGPRGSGIYNQDVAINGPYIGSWGGNTPTGSLFRESYSFPNHTPWSTAVGAAESNTVYTNQFAFAVLQAGSYGWRGWPVDKYRAWQHKNAGFYGVYAVSTSSVYMQHRTWTYIMATTNYQSQVFVTNVDSVFDEGDSGLVQGWQTLGSWMWETNVAHTQAFGSASLGTWPTWCAEPPASNTATIRGFIANDMFSATEWDFTFK